MVSPFSFSPLFRTAAREIREQAQAQWAASQVGRLVREVRRGVQSSANPAAIVTGALQRYGRNFDPHVAMRDLMDVDFRTFTRSVQRYARGDQLGRSLVREFLRSMGPAGNLIWALVGGGKGQETKKTSLDRDIDSAVRFLEAFGFEVLPPPGKRRAKIGDVQEGISKAVEFLRQVGYPVGGGAGFEEADEGLPVRSGLPFGISPTLKGGRLRKTVTLDSTLSGGRRRYPVGHPIVTGDMVDVESTNVHSFGYDIEEKSLYIRFLAPEAKKGLKEGQLPPHTPGPLYRYRNVPEDLFLSLFDAPSKGTWIWEHIRIEGTVSGHMFPYDLVGVTGGYVPRKAEFGELGAITGKAPKNAADRQYGEWYIPRKIWTTKGRALESERPLELVQAYTPSITHVKGPDKVMRPRRPHG